MNNSTYQYASSKKFSLCLASPGLIAAGILSGLLFVSPPVDAAGGSEQSALALQQAPTSSSIDDLVERYRNGSAVEKRSARAELERRKPQLDSITIALLDSLFKTTDENQSDVDKLLTQYRDADDQERQELQEQILQMPSGEVIASLLSQLVEEEEKQLAAEKRQQEQTATSLPVVLEPEEEVLQSKEITPPVEAPERKKSVTITLVAREQTEDSDGALLDLEKQPEPLKRKKPAAVPEKKVAAKTESPQKHRVVAGNPEGIDVSEESVAELIELLMSEERPLRIRITRELERRGEAAVKELNVATRHWNAKVRVWSVTALGNIGDSLAVPFVKARLKDKHPTVRERAEVALLRLRKGTATTVDNLPALSDESLIGLLTQDPREQRIAATRELEKRGEQVVPLLHAALNHWNARARAWATTALGNIGRAESVPLIQERLNDSSSVVRARARVALERLSDIPKLDLEGGNLSEKSVSELITLLMSREREQRIQVTRVLESRGDKAVPSLRKATKHWNAKVRVWSVTALGNIGSQSALPEVRAALQDPHSTVRERAVIAEKRLRTGVKSGQQESVPLATKDKRSDNVVALKKKASAPIRPPEKTSGGNVAPKKKVSFPVGEDERKGDLTTLTNKELITTLMSKSRNLRMAAAKELFVRGDAAVSELITGVTHSSVKVRFWSVTILGNIGNSRAIPYLKNALQDKDANVRTRAQIALQKMGVSSESILAARKVERQEASAPIQDSTSIEELVNRLNLKNDQELGKVRRQLVEHGEAALPRVIAATINKDPHVRVQALSILGAIGSEKAIPAINRALLDDNQAVREAAGAAMRAVKAR